MVKYYVCIESDDKLFSEVEKKSDMFRVIKFFRCKESKITIFECDGFGVDFLKEYSANGNNVIEIFDSDGAVYLATDGKIKKGNSNKKFTLRRIIKIIRKNIRIRKISSFVQNKDKKNTEKYDEDIILKNGTAIYYPSFKRLKFFNAADGKCHRFRLHIPKNKDNNDLLLFLHGAGAPGYDNFQQMYETKFIYRHLKKAKKDCFILAPQLGYSDAYNTDEHSEMLWNMINAVNKKYGKINYSRIYILGMSYGGYCTVYECFRHPERYAAAIPTVAWIYLDKDTRISSYKYGDDKYHLPFDDEGISELAKTPMWLACSHIEAEYVEYLYKRLKDVNAEVHLTRKDKHGHMMCTHFFKDEAWDEWLFGKTNNK